MSYAFTFDASACSGCKACQEACKDKNHLPAGLLWRRVIEVSGGGWQRAGNAWQNNIFAYNVSLACNHCTHPKCAGVCPTAAYSVRPDGVVVLDSSKCMGCGYCAWACPYGAPQYDVIRGVMTKCDLCIDSLDAGLPPSCVAACPLRVLNLDTIENLEAAHPADGLWQLPGLQHPFPLPKFSRTGPHLVIKPHTGMNSPLVKSISNQEELHPPGSFEKSQHTPAMHELPLVAFTLLTQMSAGMALFSLGLSSMPLPLLLSIGILLGAGGLISFLHLGKKRNAWRSMLHLRKSWISREILMASLFGSAWAVAVVSQLLRGTPSSPLPMAILGLGLVYSMACVYRLRAVAGWNSWRTPAAFFLSAAVLGAIGVSFTSSQPVWPMVASLGMLAEIGLLLSSRQAKLGGASRLRIALLGLGILGAALTAIGPQMGRGWLVIPVLLVALTAEAIGRWQFYTWRVPFLMQYT